jgi:hypothetical protein
VHECPRCGQQCDCDGKDHSQPAPADCRHECEEELVDFDDENQFEADEDEEEW